MTYFVLFPALLIQTLGKQSLVGAPWPSMLMDIVGSVMTSALLLINLRKVLTVNNATFTSIFHGGVRYNTYITQGLYGAMALSMCSVAAGFLIVLINLYCISAFVIWGKSCFQGVLSFIK